MKPSDGPTDSPPDTINLMGVLVWLRLMSKRVRFGKDNYLETLTALHNLIQERSELNKQVEKLEKEIARMKQHRSSDTWGVKGQGEWNVPDKS